MNFDIKVGGEINNNNNYNNNINSSSANFNSKPSSDYNLFNNDSWKIPDSSSISSGSLFNTVPLNGAFNKGIYSKPSYLDLNLNSVNSKAHKFGGKFIEEPNKAVKKNITSGNKKSNDNNNNNDKDGKTSVDKRFKTLPPSESLPRNETIGGYIFVCNNDTMAENLKRQLFGMLAFSVSNYVLLLRSLEYLRFR